MTTSFNPHGDALRLQPHHARPRQVSIRHNTVVASAVGIRVIGGDARFRQVVLANAVFARVALQGGEQHWNVTGTYAAAAEWLVAPFASLGALDFSPRGRALALPAAGEVPAIDRQDFYGRERHTPSAGAIAPDQPAAWLLGLSRRP